MMRLLIHLEQKLVDYSLQNQYLNFLRNRGLDHFASQSTKLQINKEIYMLLGE